MKSKFILSFMMLFPVLSMYAQRTFYGSVVSVEDSVSLPGATVECISGETSIVKTVTDKEGKFSFKTVGNENCVLQVSFIGYDTYSLQISESKKGDVDLGQIWLAASSNNLEGVTVNAGLKRIDRSIIFPTQNDVKVSYDIYSLLRTLNLHGMSIDEMNKSVSINGSSVQWKVNGVPKTDTDVRNINPKDILRIEYGDAPSMRELDNGYGGVVNIVLKEKTEGGMINLNGQAAFTTGFADGGATFQYYKGKSSLKLDYSASLRDYDEWKKDETSVFVSPDKTIDRSMRGLDSDFGYINNYLSLNYMLQPDSKTQFSVSFNNSFGYQHSKPESFYMSGVDEVHRKINSTFRGYTPSFDVFFGKSFSERDRIEANVVGTFLVTGRSRYNLTDIKVDGTKDEYATPADSKRRSIISEAFYSHSFAKGPVMSFGIQNTVGNSRNKYFEPENNRDKLDENNTYLYAQAWGRIGSKVQYSAGTGLKYNHTDNGTVKSDFWRNQTSLSLAYSPSNNIFARYSMYYFPSIPSLYAMTSVSQRIDDLQTLQGNPYLKAAQNIQNSIYLYCSKGKFNSDFTVSFTHTADPIFLTKGYDASSGLFTNSYINGKHNNQLNINWAPSLKGLFGFMNLYCTAGYSRFWAKTEDFNHTLNNFYWDVSLQLYYKEFTLSAFYIQPKKTLYNETLFRNEKSSRVTLSWQKKNLTVYAAVYNPFTPNGCNYIDENLSKYNPRKSDITISDNGNMVVLGFSLDLNFGKSYKEGNRNVRNSDNSQSILRVSE